MSLPKAILDKRICELDLLPRVRKSLARVGLLTVGDVVSRNDIDLLGIRGFSYVSLAALRKALAEFIQSIEDPQATARREALRDPDAASRRAFAQLDFASKPFVRWILDEMDSWPEVWREVARRRVFQLWRRVGEEIDAQRLHVSIEELRYIEHEVRERFPFGAALAMFADERISRVRAGRTTSLTPLGLEHSDPWFRGVTQDPGVLMRILESHWPGHRLKIEHPIIERIDEGYLSLLETLERFEERGRADPPEPHEDRGYNQGDE